MVVLVGRAIELIEMHKSLLPLLDRFVYPNRRHFYIPNFGHVVELVHSMISSYIFYI